MLEVTSRPRVSVYFKPTPWLLSCIIVQLLIFVSLVLGLHPHHVNYINKFWQAPLDHILYVKLPKHCKVTYKVLLIMKFVYGLRQSTLHLCHHYRQGLDSRGFYKSDHDN